MTEIANAKRLDESEQDIESRASGWHLKLFGKSVLKQAKLQNITRELGSTESLRCLDLGSDNGVMSYLLRQRGGEWFSADLSEETVSSIRSLVQENVQLIDGKNLPFEDSFFDVVVVVDMLEHLEDDRRFLSELCRILKQDGRIILNTPNSKPYSPLRGLRELIGQGDYEHGHVHSGYSVSKLNAVLPSALYIHTTWTYSRFFSESIDTVIVASYRLLQATKKAKSPSQERVHTEVSKGLVMTEDKLKSFKKSFALYSKIYPLVKAVASLDRLISFIPGFMRLAVIKKH